MSADGRTTYVAVTDGFATVDVTDPTEPTVLAERRDLLESEAFGPLRDVRDVKLDGDRLVVAGPAEGGFLLQGFLVYDVADPANPEQLAFYEAGHPVHNCDIDGPVVYLAPAVPNLPLAVVDVSTDEPREIATWDLADYDPGYHETAGTIRPLHDVVVRDDYAYVSWWDAGTWILDVSDPSAPTYVSHVSDFTLEELQAFRAFAEETHLAFEEPPGNDHSAAVDEEGTLLAVGKESWDSPEDDDNEGPSGIDLWDVTDRSRPESLATIEPARPSDATRTGVVATAHNFDVHGDHLYSSWYQDGVKIHDVSDPVTPTLLAHWRTPDSRSFFTAQLAVPGKFFVATNRSTGDRQEASVLTFPDESGEQPDMPPLESGT